MSQREGQKQNISQTMSNKYFTDAEMTAKYLSHRPQYPHELFKAIAKYYFDNKDLDEFITKIPFAVDIACGNGQATIDLSKYVF